MPDVLETEVLHVDLIDYGDVGVFERSFYGGRWQYRIVYYNADGKKSSRLPKTFTLWEAQLILEGLKNG